VIARRGNKLDLIVSDHGTEFKGSFEDCWLFGFHVCGGTSSFSEHPQARRRSGALVCSGVGLLDCGTEREAFGYYV
jgi:hypothetical protein